MGWCTDIKLNKQITEDELDKFLKMMLHHYKGPFGMSKQSWGWSMAVDVRHYPTEIRMTGSYSMSGVIRYLFAEDLKNILVHNGFKEVNIKHYD